MSKTKTKIIDKNISKLTDELKVVRKIYNIGGLSHLVFDKIPDDLKLDKSVERGRRVLTSCYPESHDIFLVKYFDKGERHFPYGGVKVYNKTADEYKVLYPESVVKHKNVEFYNKIEE